MSKINFMQTQILAGYPALPAAPFNIRCILPYSLTLTPLSQRSAAYRVAKRVVDVVLATAMLILSLPISLAIAIAIKLDSPGPVLIRQDRIGLDRREQKSPVKVERRRQDLHGRPFGMFKFRSMYSSADLYACKPRNSQDPRITRVGRFLRKTSLDELPQLFNVLRGDMSLVGPRPEMPFVVQKYDEYHALRLLAKPGLTGYWQLYGSRRHEMMRQAHWDIAYIEKQSMLVDLQILLATIKFVLLMKNV